MRELENRGRLRWRSTKHWEAQRRVRDLVVHTFIQCTYDTDTVIISAFLLTVLSLSVYGELKIRTTVVPTMVESRIPNSRTMVTQEARGRGALPAGKHVAETHGGASDAVWLTSRRESEKR